MYDSLYGREGRGIGPNEPEKKGFARFCQMVGRDLGQLLGLLCFVSAFLFEAAAQQGYYPGLAILAFLALDFLVLAVGFTLCMAALQTLFPALRSEYGVEVRSIPRPAAPEQPLSAQEQKKRSRANWWYYHWGIVAVAAVVAVSVVYAAHGLMTAVDPDYTVAVVTAESLPDEAVQNLQSALEQYADDANGDGTVLVQVNNYTWSANASLTDMNGQMAGATQMNSDLANGESKLWFLEDP